MNFFVDKNQIHENKIDILGTDVNHIKNVLRKEVGDELNIVSENKEYISKIISLDQDKIECEILNEIENEDNGPKITIFQGLAKADKIEYIIQKCSEIGATSLVPTEMKRCVVKLDSKDKAKKLERWQKIAEVAAKQSLRFDILKVEEVQKIEDVAKRHFEFDLSIVAYENEKETSLKKVLKDVNKSNLKIAVIIGPEGGLEMQEVELLQNNGAKVVTLGKRILRTETAPIVICSNIMYELDN